MMFYQKQLAEQLTKRFPLLDAVVAYDEVTLAVPAGELLDVAKALCSEAAFAFEQLVDVCAVDYLHYGLDEWRTQGATETGFSRGIEPATTGHLKFNAYASHAALGHSRFSVVYHLLSYQHNRRLRLKVNAFDEQMPIVPSVIEIWSSADWYEREAFDLYGILFEGHPDLRRILTDYGFIGHPFRKDFPLIGHVEMRYDPEKGRVVYEPVSIEPRVLVPKVVRDDHRSLVEKASSNRKSKA